MNRRRFLQAAGVASAGAFVPGALRAGGRAGVAAGDDAAAVSVGSTWHTYELTTRVEVMKYPGATRVWVPAVLPNELPFQRSLGNSIETVGGKGTVNQDGREFFAVAYAEFPAGVAPVFSVTSRVATRDYFVDLSLPGTSAAVLTPAERAYYLRATKLQPTDGIVRDTALRITAGAGSDVEKARAIYEWIVENTFRNPKTRGCGLGDIRFMLESGDLGGKCADLNALCVGLARAAGLPARHAYGIRVAPSALGYKSLGPATENVTHGQHCRAEVFLAGYGWVPMDPADVRKVILEEPGNLTLNDDMVKKARTRLFGSWDMNWIAYNFANDVTLPGATDAATLPFLMYTQGESGGAKIDPYDQENFKYTITSKTIATDDAAAG
jgi:transglutaminase-like putative cysteine protease